MNVDSERQTRADAVMPVSPVFGEHSIPVTHAYRVIDAEAAKAEGVFEFIARSGKDTAGFAGNILNAPDKSGIGEQTQADFFESKDAKNGCCQPGQQRNPVFGGGEGRSIANDELPVAAHAIGGGQKHDTGSLDGQINLEVIVARETYKILSQRGSTLPHAARLYKKGLPGERREIGENRNVRP